MCFWCFKIFECLQSPPSTPSHTHLDVTFAQVLCDLGAALLIKATQHLVCTVHEVRVTTQAAEDARKLDGDVAVDAVGIVDTSESKQLLVIIYYS